MGDFLFVNKALYGAEVPLIHMRLPAFRSPRLGDIVVFDSQTEDGVKVVKRLVGMPGDTLQMKNAVLWRNGVAQREPYVEHVDSLEDPTRPEDARLADRLPAAGRGPRHLPSRPRDNWGPLVVPRDSFFVMGDNRDNSYDSRYWGFVPRQGDPGPAVVHLLLLRPRLLAGAAVPHRHPVEQDRAPAPLV